MGISRGRSPKQLGLLHKRNTKKCFFSPLFCPINRQGMGLFWRCGMPGITLIYFPPRPNSFPASQPPSPAPLPTFQQVVGPVDIELAGANEAKEEGVILVLHLLCHRLAHLLTARPLPHQLPQRLHRHLPLLLCLIQLILCLEAHPKTPHLCTKSWGMQ